MYEESNRLAKELQEITKFLSVLWYGLYLYRHLLLKENACSARYLPLW